MFWGSKECRKGDPSPLGPPPNGARGHACSSGAEFSFGLDRMSWDAPGRSIQSKRRPLSRQVSLTSFCRIWSYQFTRLGGKEPVLLGQAGLVGHGSLILHVTRPFSSQDVAVDKKGRPKQCTPPCPGLPRQRVLQIVSNAPCHDCFMN